MKTSFFKLFMLCSYAGVVFCEFPTGHLQPFGHHRPPAIVIDEITREKALRPQEFYETYVEQRKPVIFRNAIVDSKAYQLWTDEYIRTNFGDLEIRLESKKEKTHMPPMGEKYIGRDNLRHFVDNYHKEGNDMYVVSDLPSKMYHDMSVIPSFGACGEMSRYIVEIDMWWSGGGSSSIIHKDAFNQMNCLLNGTKYWKLIPHIYEKDIYKHNEDKDEVGGFSDINPASVDLIKYPKVQNVEWANITINAGDCLFLPKGEFHQVYSVGTNNKAVSILFSRFDDRDELDFSDCAENTDYKTIRSLAEFDVQWMWHGKGVMVMGNADFETGVKLIMREYIRWAENNQEKFGVELLESMLQNSDATNGAEGINIEELFSEMDVDGDGNISTDDLNAMSIDVVRRVATQVEKYEPANNYEYEYSVVPFEKVWALIKVCTSNYKILKKEVWLKYYKKAGGSTLFGEEIFSKLSGDKTQLISEEVTDEIIYDALWNWVTYYADQYSNLMKPPTDLSMNRTWFLGGMKWLVADSIVRLRSQKETSNQEREKHDEL